MVDSDSDEELHNKGPKEAVPQLSSPPPAQIGKPMPKPKDVIAIDSDSDDDEYGSFPSVADLPATISGDAAAEDVRADGLVSSSSDDEFGSFPASPNLLALT